MVRRSLKTSFHALSGAARRALHHVLALLLTCTAVLLVMVWAPLPDRCPPQQKGRACGVDVSISQLHLQTR